MREKPDATICYANGKVATGVAGSSKKGGMYSNGGDDLPKYSYQAGWAIPVE